jgi:hypothetical protein
VIHLHSLESIVAAHRPPGAPAREAATLGEIAGRWRAELAETLTAAGLETLALATGEIDELAAAMTELAEDLRADNGLWRALESANLGLFGTPLPLVWRAGDTPLGLFDARRFQFLLCTVWRHFKPHRLVSPTHPGLAVVAGRAAPFFAAAFSAHPRGSSIAAFLGTANARGWDVKRKLVWLGTHGFLFRFAYADYLARNPPKDADRVGTTDDFLCQECTAWSGLGALDLLAAVLELPDADRATLRSWHERHAAFFRVDAVHFRSAEVETMTVTNLINDEPYPVRLEVPRARCPFAQGQMVFGSLVPWRGEWYWSGAQQSYRQVPDDVATIKRAMIEKSPAIAYRYRPDLAARARQSAAEQRAAFIRAL